MMVESRHIGLNFCDGFTLSTLYAMNPNVNIKWVKNNILLPKNISQKVFLYLVVVLDKPDH